MRKPKEDVLARGRAEHVLSEALESVGLTGAAGEYPASGVREALSTFPAVEFETLTKKVGDQELHLRRLVVTGSWEIDPNPTRPF